MNLTPFSTGSLLKQAEGNMLKLLMLSKHCFASQERPSLEHAERICVCRLQAPADCVRALLAAAAEAELVGECICQQASKGVCASVPDVLFVLHFFRHAFAG